MEKYFIDYRESFSEGNKDYECIYDVKYDEEKLLDLINRIVKELNYTTKESFGFNNIVEIDEDERTITEEGYLLPNGDSKYINVDHVGGGGYLHVECDLVHVPELAYILMNAYEGYYTAFSCLMNYKNHDELKSPEEIIKNYNYFIDSIPNDNFSVKIEALNQFKNYMNKIENNRYYSIDKLNAFYKEALDIFKLYLREIREKINESKSCSLGLYLDKKDEKTYVINDLFLNNNNDKILVNKNKRDSF